MLNENANRPGPEFLSMAVSGNNRILVGPWRGEVGTEVTYWMPWVRRVAVDIPDFWERAVVVSRGGMGRLYHPGVETVDLYELYGVEEVARENLVAKSELGWNKPIKWTEWEQDVTDEIVRARYGRSAYLHPSGMTAVLMPYWEGRAGLETAAAHLDISLLEKPPKPDWLPERYTAVKWYHREGKFDIHVHEAWRRLLLENDDCTVWVGSGSGYDRHIDGMKYATTTSMPDGPAEDNLYRQAQVIAHAEKFVGTYGGTAQLALRFGVPTVAFYPGREPRHRAWNQWVAHQTGVPFVSGSLCELPLMRSVLG